MIGDIPNPVGIESRADESADSTHHIHTSKEVPHVGGSTGGDEAAAHPTQ